MNACTTVPLSECLVNDCCCHSVATVVDVIEPRVVLPFFCAQEDVADMDVLFDIPVMSSPTIPC